jgi:hypothetical protein
LNQTPGFGDNEAVHGHQLTRKKHIMRRLSSLAAAVLALAILVPSSPSVAAKKRAGAALTSSTENGAAHVAIPAFMKNARKAKTSENRAKKAKP